jgi:hypothetical protein
MVTSAQFFPIAHVLTAGGVALCDCDWQQGTSLRARRKRSDKSLWLWPAATKSANSSQRNWRRYRDGLRILSLRVGVCSECVAMEKVGRGVRWVRCGCGPTRNRKPQGRRGRVPFAISRPTTCCRRRRRQRLVAGLPAEWHLRNQLCWHSQQVRQLLCCRPACSLRLQQPLTSLTRGHRPLQWCHHGGCRPTLTFRAAGLPCPARLAEDPESR